MYNRFSIRMTTLVKEIQNPAIPLNLSLVNLEHGGTLVVSIML